MKLFQFLILFSTLTFVSSCYYPENYFKPEPECKSENVKDLSSENQFSMVNELKNKKPADYRYFFKTFERVGDHTFMVTNFRNEEACFDVRILVNKWDKLAEMKRTNGVSYPNELYNLKWEIKSMHGNEIVEYIDMHRIID